MILMMSLRGMSACVAVAGMAVAGDFRRTEAQQRDERGETYDPVKGIVAVVVVDGVGYGL